MAQREQTRPRCSSTSSFPEDRGGAQSWSLVVAQPVGQQPSSWTQAVCMPAVMQVAEHVATVPCRVNLVQPRLGQLVGQDPGGSHFSPLSMIPLPQTRAFNIASPE